MNSSRPQSLFQEAGESSAESRENLSVYQNVKSFPSTSRPSVLDDADLVRSLLVSAIKASGKTRAQIADEMTFYLGRSVTDKMLDAFTAATRADRRWPAEFDRAFCTATGNYDLLIRRMELCGFHVITDKERTLLELGRKYLTRKRSEAEMADLERRLEGSEL